MILTSSIHQPMIISLNITPCWIKYSTWFRSDPNRRTRRNSTIFSRRTTMGNRPKSSLSLRTKFSSHSRYKNPSSPFSYFYHDRAPLIETIAHAFEDIFLHQTNTFKINLSFSFILQHRETGEF